MRKLTKIELEKEDETVLPFIFLDNEETKRKFDEHYDRLQSRWKEKLDIEGIKFQRLYGTKTSVIGSAMDEWVHDNMGRFVDDLIEDFDTVINDCDMKPERNKEEVSVQDLKQMTAQFRPHNPIGLKLSKEIDKLLLAALPDLIYDELKFIRENESENPDYKEVSDFLSSTVDTYYEVSPLMKKLNKVLYNH